MFEETVSCLLSDFRTEWILGDLRFLEKFGNFFKAGV